ncbi:MAG: hypothetical protein FJ005_08195 [Chloroflexi bacterium]|nr:hypothetical protein [Chloroflexota bacterium]
MKVCNPNQQSRIIRAIASVWCIICTMLELYKRCWVAFFPIFAVCMGLALQAYIWLDNKPYQYTAIIIFLLMAIIALIIGIIAFVYDIQYCRRKDKEEKAKASFEALKESFKRLGLNDKQAEIAARGR